MQASLLLPTLIHILTPCRRPYHEAPETPPRRARAGHPVATEKRVKTRRTGIPPTTRRNDAAPKIRTARRPQLRIAHASARKRTYPPRNIHSIHSTHSVHSTQHPPRSTSQLRHNRIGSARQRTPHTTEHPQHPTAQRYRARLRDARRKRIAAKRAATLPHDANAPGSSWIRGRSSCGDRDYLRYTFS